MKKMNSFQEKIIAITTEKFASSTELEEHIAEHLNEAELDWPYTDIETGTAIILGMILTAGVCLQIQLQKLYRYSEGMRPLFVTPMPDAIEWVKGGAILEFTNALSHISIVEDEIDGEPLDFSNGIDVFDCNSLFDECLDEAAKLCSELYDACGNDRFLEAAQFSIAMLSQFTLAETVKEYDLSTLNTRAAQAINALTIEIIEMMADSMASKYECPQFDDVEEDEHQAMH